MTTLARRSSPRAAASKEEMTCPVCQQEHAAGAPCPPGVASSDPLIGKPLGDYGLVRELGRGSAGVVYLAERTEPIRQTVAVKVLKLGTDSRRIMARFEAERNVLAMMEHPHIARIFDAGLTDDRRPYFVMEYVPGEPITAFCDRRKLTVRQRLELFRLVCEAIQHAHHKAVIHRDVKPSNLLVVEQDGRALVKVIDFGVANGGRYPAVHAGVHEPGAGCRGARRGGYAFGHLLAGGGAL